MSGNEILLNLQNAQHFRLTQIIGALTALSYVKDQKQYNWNQHPWTSGAFDILNKHIGQMRMKNLVQTSLALDKLECQNVEIWGKLGTHILRIMHKLRSQDLYRIFDVFDRSLNRKVEIEDVMTQDILSVAATNQNNSSTKSQGENNNKKNTQLSQNIEGKIVNFKITGIDPVSIQYGSNNTRIGPEFFERLVAFLPVHLRNLSPSQITRVHEVCSERNIGSDRLYDQFFYFYMQKYAQRFTLKDYITNLKSLAKRIYQNDMDFWDQIFLPVIYKKKLTLADALELKDVLIFVKFSCPFVNIKNVLGYIEDIIEKFNNIQDYDQLTEFQKSEIKLRGTVPDSEKAKIRKKILLMEMKNNLAKSNEEIQLVDDEDDDGGFQKRKKGAAAEDQDDFDLEERKQQRIEKLQKIKQRKAMRQGSK